jgi:hypothetical protein
MLWEEAEAPEPRSARGSQAATGAPALLRGIVRFVVVGSVAMVLTAQVGGIRLAAPVDADPSYCACGGRAPPRRACCPGALRLVAPAPLSLLVAGLDACGVKEPCWAGLLALLGLHDAVGGIRIDGRRETDATHLRGQHHRHGTDDDEPHNAAEQRRRARRSLEASR